MDIQLKQKKGLKKKHIPYILGGVLLLFILWLILGDHSSTLVIDSRTITVGTARNDLFNDYIRVNGTVQPITILQLSPWRAAWSKSGTSKRATRSKRET